MLQNCRTIHLILMGLCPTEVLIKVLIKFWVSLIECWGITFDGQAGGIEISARGLSATRLKKVNFSYLILNGNTVHK